MDKYTRRFVEGRFLKYAGSIPYEDNELRFSGVYNEVAIDILEDICKATGVFQDHSGEEEDYD